MRFGRAGRRLLVAGAAALLLIAGVPIAAFAWLLWNGDEMIPYPDGPPPTPTPPPSTR